MLDTPKEGVYLSACGRAMSLMARSPAAWVLETEDYAPRLLDPVQAQAAWDRDREKLVLYLYHLEDSRQTVTFDYAALGASLSAGTAEAVYAETLYDMNTQADPGRIRRITLEILPDDNVKTVALTAPPHSFVMAVLPRKKEQEATASYR